MSDIASILYPSDPFGTKPAETSQANPPAGSEAKPVPDSGQKGEAAPGPPQATQEASAAEILFGSNAEAQAKEKLDVNVEGMAPDNPDQYTIKPPEGWQMDEGGEEELQAAREGFHAVGLPQDMVDDFMGHAVAAVDTPITTTADEAMADLRKIYGSRADEKIGMARQLVAKAATKWPSIYAYLNSNGLGNSPDIIIKTIARAEAMKRKGLL